MRAARVALSVCVVLSWPALAVAQATFTTQIRQVETRSRSDLSLWQQGTNPQTDPATVTYTANDDHLTVAPDFTPFTATVSSTAPPVVGPAVRDGDASASQTSSLSPGAITASGSVSASGEALFPDAGVISAVNSILQPPVPYFFGYLRGRETGRSQLTITFDLSEPTPYTLVGTLTAGPGFPGFPSQFMSSEASIDLIGPEGEAFSDDAISCDCERELDQEGILAPGTYTLYLDAGSNVAPICDLVSCNSYATDSAFDVTLSLAGAPVVPGPSRGAVALLGLTLAAIGAAVLRRA